MFTGRLGTDLSQLGNIELAFVPSLVPPVILEQPCPYAPERLSEGETRRQRPDAAESRRGRTDPGQGFRLRPDTCRS
jgi:hypothetical protein